MDAIVLCVFFVTTVTVFMRKSGTAVRPIIVHFYIILFSLMRSVQSAVRSVQIIRKLLCISQHSSCGLRVLASGAPLLPEQLNLPVSGSFSEGSGQK